MQLTRLVYVSNHGGTTEEALGDILATSRRNNERDGITGVLVASDEDFMQCLEGSRTAVAECMMRIMKDERHQKIRILLAGETESRLFSQWSMRCIETPQIELDTVSTALSIQCSCRKLGLRNFAWLCRKAPGW
jgi:hypothetical protein